MNSTHLTKSDSGQVPDESAQAPLLRPDEAARLLAVKPSWVYDAVRHHRIPCVRIGRHIRFTRAMLNEWIAEQREV